MGCDLRACAVAAVIVVLSVIQATADAELELGSLTIEELMNLEVTSASRKSERLGDAAAAIYVVSADDIRRAGAQSVPEALRLVPGLHVARIDANKWAISARGFNDRYANRLLVLMDGRHLYTPFFSGVFWDEHTLPIDNIERIEIIRGPGATLWGSNAVNGIINIITRSARDTQGWMVQAKAGSREMAGATARYGATTPTGWSYRIDVDSTESNVTESPLANDDHDDWSQRRLGVRIDGEPRPNHHVTLETAIHQGDSEETVRYLDGLPLELRVDNGNVDTQGVWLSVNWERTREHGGGWSLRAYADHSERDMRIADLKQTVFSVDFQSRHILSARHDVVWGLGMRTADLPFTSNVQNFVELVDDDSYALFEVFLQDEIRLAETVRAVLGAKVERSEYADVEVQPNLRLAWRASDRVSVWGAVSKAVRTPSRGEVHLRINPVVLAPPLTPPFNVPVPATFAIDGNVGVGSEAVTAFEIGARMAFSDSLHVDLALFHNEYDDLVSSQPTGTLCQLGNVDITIDPLCVLSASYVQLVSNIDNSLAATSRGGEFSFEWRPSRAWSLSGAYSRVSIEHDVPVASVPGAGEPEHLGHIRSAWNISPALELDLSVRMADAAPRFSIDRYLTADLRIGWRPSASMSVEILGNNLLDDGHTEFGSLLGEVLPSGVRRSVAARFTWAP